MGIYSTLIYQPEIKEDEELNREKILDMMKDIGKSIGGICPLFKKNSPEHIFEFIKYGSYSGYHVDDGKPITIDLSKAREVIARYLCSDIKKGTKKDLSQLVLEDIR